MKKSLLFVSLLFVLASTIFMFSCGKSSSYNSNPGGGVPPTTNTVSIVNMAFSSATLTVTAGTTVTWTNSDAMAHTVTSDDNTSFDSENILTGGKFAKLFSTAGTFTYHCTIHSGMKGTIVVK